MSKARDLANAGTALGAVTATELGYVDGVTSAIQTQIDSKIGSASAINPTIVDAKGDIIAATAADTVARLAVGSNNTILTADSTTATGLKWAAPAGGGKLLQLVTATGTSTNITSTSFTDVNLTATITPTSATSRVYVIISMGFYISRNQTNLQSDVQLLRGATSIWTTTSNNGISVAQLNQPANMSGILPITYVDSPATTSATTYKVQAKVFSTANGMSLDCNNYQTSVITLLEIGA